MPDKSAKSPVPLDPTLRRKSEGKIAKGKYDVFLCYKSEDKTAVKHIGNQLKDRAIGNRSFSA